jgi:uncharacterized protein (DUF58 family)
MINKNVVEQYSKLEFLAKKVVEGFITGIHKSPFHGFSVEFAEHRLYNSGESTKHLNWKVYAKTEKLFIKKYDEETNLRCSILIDTSSSMFFPTTSSNNKLNFSINATAALIYMLKTQRDAFGINLFNDKIYQYTAVKSSEMHKQMIFALLEKSLNEFNEKDKKTTQTVEALHEMAERVHTRSLVIIFSDMFSDFDKSNEIFNALLHLKKEKHEVILFHVVDKSKEIDFEFENRAYHFIDLESNNEVKLHSSELKEIYTEKMKSFELEILNRCQSFGIDFIKADINEGFDTILKQYLIKRNKMK